MVPAPVPMIVRVFVEGEVSEVPVTPETTCRDVIECVRDPGEEQCALLQIWGPGCERVLRDCDKPLEILQEWGPRRDMPCRLVLRYTVLPSSSINGGGSETRNGMKEPGFFVDSSLPEGVELTLSELEQMACRQQAQIDSQRQLLAAKEQRLRFLKQHEARHQQVAAEHERLRRLRDRVEAQELKLRKLRALRGQVHQNKLNNASLTSDLDSIRALFNEKEKELSLAVAKVEELTRQLEDLRRGRANATARETVQPAAAAQELEKLRRELMYRNKLNEQQNARLSQQREALSQRQEEMVSIDKRIAELQDRLHRKRLLNQQLASQINHQQHLRSTVSHHQQQHGTSPGTRGNIAAVEPYHHVPSSKATMDHMPILPARHNIYQMKPVVEQNQNRRLQNSNAPSDPSLIHEQGMHDDFAVLKMRKNSLSSAASQSVLPSAMLYTSANIQNNYQHDNIINSENNNLKIKDDNKLSNAINSNLTSDAILGTTVTSTTTAMSSTTTDVIPEFGASKLDPKYQTLPYNTKFTINYLSSSQPMTSSSSTQPSGVNKNVNSVNSNSSGINNLIGRRPSGEGGENVIDNIGDEMKNVNSNSQQQQSQQVMNVVYSIPIPSGINKGLATGLANEIRPTSVSSVATSSVSSLSNSPSPSSSAVTGSTITTRMGLLMSRGQPVGGASSTTSSTSSLATNSSAGSSSTNHQKPVSSVAPTSVQQQQLYNQSQSHSSIPVPNKILSSTISSASLSQPSSQSCTAQVQDLTASPIYQTSSTKIHPVQPQILTSASHGILRDQKGECSSSSPQGSCSPLSSPDSPGTPKPALPPKPAVPIKPTPPPPPRQITHWPPESTSGSDKLITNSGEGLCTSDSKKLVWPPPAVDISADAVDSALNVLRGAVTLSTRGGLSTHDIQSNKPNQPYQTVDSETSNTMGSGSLSQLIINEPSIPPPPPTSEPPLEETPPPRRLNDQQIIKARPLTIRKQPLNEMPRLRNGSSFGNTTSGMVSSSTLQDNNENINNYNNHRLTSNESGSSSSESNETMNTTTTNVQFSMSRRIEMPPAFLFPENEAPPADLIPAISNDLSDQTNNNNSMSVSSVDDSTDENNKLNDNNSNNNNINNNNNNNNSDTINKSDDSGSNSGCSDIETKNNINKEQQSGGDNVIVRRVKKGNLKGSKQVSGGQVMSRRVSFDPLALLLDASLEGELELVIRTAGQVRDPSAANDEGITALHNAICAGHLDIVRFLVQFGCDVNAQDSDGWTPLHCAASCNNLPMVRFLVEHGACIFATTLSDHETAAEKCEEDEEGFDGCSEYLYSVQEKLGILNSGAVYAVFSYEAHNSDELSFNEGDRLVVLRKGDEWEREWWWARLNDQEGYIPRNLLGLYPRVHPNKMPE